MRRTPRLWWTAVAMTALSGAVGAYFGNLSEYMYVGSDDELPGDLLGAAAGIAVGVAWCLLVIRAGDRAARRGRSGKLILAPVLGGIAAGCVATVLLHLGMQLIQGHEEGLVKHLIGQAFGSVAGLLSGMVGGAVWPPVRVDAPASPGARPDAGAGTIAG